MKMQNSLRFILKAVAGCVILYGDAANAQDPAPTPESPCYCTFTYYSLSEDSPDCNGACSTTVPKLMDGNCPQVPLTITSIGDKCGVVMGTLECSTDASTIPTASSSCDNPDGKRGASLIFGGSGDDSYVYTIIDNNLNGGGTGETGGTGSTGGTSGTTVPPKTAAGGTSGSDTLIPSPGKNFPPYSGTLSDASSKLAGLVTGAEISSTNVGPIISVAENELIKSALPFTAYLGTIQALKNAPTSVIIFNRSSTTSLNLVIDYSAGITPDSYPPLPTATLSPSPSPSASLAALLDSVIALPIKTRLMSLSTAGSISKSVPPLGTVIVPLYVYGKDFGSFAGYVDVKVDGIAYPRTNLTVDVLIPYAELAVGAFVSGAPVALSSHPYTATSIGSLKGLTRDLMVPISLKNIGGRTATIVPPNLPTGVKISEGAWPSQLAPGASAYFTLALSPSVAVDQLFLPLVQSGTTSLPSELFLSWKK